MATLLLASPLSLFVQNAAFCFRTECRIRTPLPRPRSRPAVASAEDDFFAATTYMTYAAVELRSGADGSSFDALAGLPLAGLPLATGLALRAQLPLCTRAPLSGTGQAAR